MRRASSNRQSGKSSANPAGPSAAVPGAGGAGRNQGHGGLEMPPVETVVARLETLNKLLQESAQTRVSQVFAEIQVLADDLRKVGPYLEQAYPDALDRVIATMRDASASPALPPSLRFAVFELVELRAAKWNLPPDTCDYYRRRRILHQARDGIEPESPSTDLGVGLSHLSVGFSGLSMDSEPVEQQQHQQQVYTPPAQPVQVAPKALRQEILIKNSDSGKVMGVRGRRISKIEKLSDTIVSFEKVEPLAKDRVLSINGYTLQSINLAKQLILETIVRNSSPVFDGPPASAGSALAPISLLQRPIPARQLPKPDIISGQHKGYALDRGASCSALDQVLLGLNNFLNNNIGVGAIGTKTNANSIHSTCTAPAAAHAAAAVSVPLFNYTVTVGSQTLRVSGNNLNLVQEAKLALDDYFVQKYPPNFYTMHVRTKTTPNTNCDDDDDDEEEEEDDGNCDLDLRPVSVRPGLNYGLCLGVDDIRPQLRLRDKNGEGSNTAIRRCKSLYHNPSKSYDRSELLMLSLGGKAAKPPDFSHLDQSTKDNIVLQRPRCVDHFKVGLGFGHGISRSASASTSGHGHSTLPLSLQSLTKK